MTTSPPNWTDVGGALTSIGTFLVILAGVILAKLQLDQARQARQADLLAEFSRRWDELRVERRAANSGEPADLAKRIRELYEANAEDYYNLSRVPNLLEDLAVEVIERHIPLSMVRKTFGDAVTYQWSRWGPATEFLRDDQPFVYENLEHLARMLKQG